jgi:hypothetical protein
VFCHKSLYKKTLLFFIFSFSFLYLSIANPTSGTLPGSQSSIVTFTRENTKPQESQDKDLINNIVEKTTRALTFNQGDLNSFLDAKDDFTETGWGNFLMSLKGWLDEGGKPTYNSSFTVSEILDHTEDQFILYGELKQKQGFSSTTYKATVEVYIEKTNIKIIDLVVNILPSYKNNKK